LEDAHKYRAIVDFARALGDAPVGEIAMFDLNDDDMITEADTLYFLTERLGTSPGDANLDGQVDGADLNDFLANFGLTGGWRQFDFDGDGAVDGSDFLTWERNLGAGGAASPATSVPEPSASLALVMASVLYSLARGGRRKTLE
jgi:hypothetical protein